MEVPHDEDQQSQPVSLEFTMLSLDFDMILLLKLCSNIVAKLLINCLLYAGLDGISGCFTHFMY